MIEVPHPPPPPPPPLCCGVASMTLILWASICLNGFDHTNEVWLVVVVVVVRVLCAVYSNRMHLRGIFVCLVIFKGSAHKFVLWRVTRLVPTGHDLTCRSHDLTCRSHDLTCRSHYLIHDSHPTV